MLTANDFALQMINQARLIDPSFSGEIGTPERIIIDTVAQTLANNQIDISGLGNALNIDSKLGSNLDAFANMFGMQRQPATAATGYVVFSRNSPAPNDISIAANTVIQASNVSVNTPTSIQYFTTVTGVIPQGLVQSAPVPVQSLVVGSAGNVPAFSLIQLVGAPVTGVTAVTNPIAIVNGLDEEDDNSFKARFSNTWARNLAGTTSQYLALALAGTFTTKATVLGSQSLYKEYIQVPDCDDAGYTNGVPFALDGVFQTTFGDPGRWTTALSDIPYAKDIFTTTPAFAINDQETPIYFYRPNVDFTFNYPPVISGDALRDSVTTQGLQVYATVGGTIGSGVFSGYFGEGIDVYGGSGTFGTDPTYIPGTVYTITSTPSTLPALSTGGFPGDGYLVLNDNFSDLMQYDGITDFTFENVISVSGNPITVNAGDTLSFVQLLPQDVIYASSVQGFPFQGVLVLGTGFPYIGNLVAYTGIDYESNAFTGCSIISSTGGRFGEDGIYGEDDIFAGGVEGTPSTGGYGFGVEGTFGSGGLYGEDLGTTEGLNAIDYFTQIYLLPGDTTPNYTFLNVFNPLNNLTAVTGLQTLVPGQVVLSEYSYVSTASRNDIQHNINNAVDVYVNGANDIQASTIFLPAVLSTNTMFTDDPSSAYYIEHFRRDGNLAKRPQLGNYLTPLYQSPIDALPSTIQVDGQNFYLGYHYFLVHEIGDLQGSTRARDGIEWVATLDGDTSDMRPGDINAPYLPALAVVPENIVSFSDDTNPIPIEVDNYLYDSNIVILQTSMDAAKQITTDVLVHKALQRYFKLDITVMYAAQASSVTTNATIAGAVQAYFDNQYFGTVVQLSNLLTAANVSGLQNIRWSNDLPIPPSRIRVYETDVNGIPLHGASIDRWIYGSSVTPERQTLYIAGSPSGFQNGTPDSFTLIWQDPSAVVTGGFIITDPIPFFDPITGAPVSASIIQQAIQSAAIDAGAVALYTNVFVSEDGRSAIDVDKSIRSFTIQYGTFGTPYLPIVTNAITSSQYAYNGDFFLFDNELPSLPNSMLITDTLPGLIIRTRAQNTWSRTGLG